MLPIPPNRGSRPPPFGVDPGPPPLVPPNNPAPPPAALGRKLKLCLSPLLGDPGPPPSPFGSACACASALRKGSSVRSHFFFRNRFPLSKAAQQQREEGGGAAAARSRTSPGRKKCRRRATDFTEEIVLAPHATRSGEDIGLTPRPRSLVLQGTSSCRKPESATAPGPPIGYKWWPRTDPLPALSIR